ncbi:MAG: LpxL/LpxP family Kdo(2)-lipid IV(A) lauroyl/palmitoleoyl acyltransferase [Proteobacteria bacterium]|nr:LpxL/LpxP family Kdo(2)-lipid IV(A) lauroyl/palmitoleoyl acyltransferase [Pseudomonadota bacterium]
MKKPSMIKYAPSWLVYGLIWLIAQLPYQLIILLGKGLGKLLLLILKSRKKVVAINLDICFPELSPLEKQSLVKKHFAELGIMLTQTIKAFLGTTKNIEKNALIKGSEHIEACLENNQGILLVAGHFTALDMGGKILCDKYSIAGMYREHKHPLTEYIVTKSRLNYANKMFKRDELRPIIKHLKAGGILWYAPDQDYRRGQSVFVPFFGKQASTITATHQMARLSKCKVLFFHVQRNQKPPYYTLTLSPAMENFPSKDPVADTARVNQGVEEMVNKNPAEYLWVHKRFKTRPEGE